MKTPRLYNLIIQSEDKNRTLIETLIYALLIASVVVSICRAAVQPVVLPHDIAAASSNSEYHA